MDMIVISTPTVRHTNEEEEEEEEEEGEENQKRLCPHISA
jgi:hypothetical protein